MAKKEIPGDRDQQSYRNLTTAASSLNAATDKLNNSVSEFDDSLKKLGLGISCWVTFAEGESPDGDEYDLDEVGYSKVGGKWGLSIRNVSGQHHDPRTEKVDVWHFSDAPRHLRVGAIRKIPNLLDKIIKDAGEFTKKLEAAAEEISSLSRGIARHADDADIEAEQNKSVPLPPEEEFDMEAALGLPKKDSPLGAKLLQALRPEK